MNPELELAIADARMERPVKTKEKCERCDRRAGHHGAHVTFCFRKTVAWTE